MKSRAYRRQGFLGDRLAQEEKEKRLAEIEKYPDRHVHSWGDLQECCALQGSVQEDLLKAHQKFVDFGPDYKKLCSTLDGPCACGQVHLATPAYLEVIKALNRNKRLGL